MAKFAFVFSIFLGDLYIPGAMVMAYSLFKTDTKHDVVCMVTPDISEEAKARMTNIGIKVINVEYINTNAYLEERPSMKRRYPNIGKFNTKWNCLKLTQYKKVFLLDVDMIVTKNIDHIFDLPTPATRLVACLTTKTIVLRSILIMKDGEKLPKAIAKKFLYKQNGSIDGGCMLLTPNMNKYNKFIEYSKQFDPRTFKTHMSDDELALFSFYIDQKKVWHYLGIEWSCIQWKMGDICSQENSYIINYIGIEKPWVKDLRKYPDMITWYENYNNMNKEYPNIFDYFKKNNKMINF